MKCAVLKKNDVLILLFSIFLAYSFILTVSSNHTFEPAYNIDMDAYCYDYKDKIGLSEISCKHREFLGGVAGDSIHYFAIALGKEEASFPPYTLRPFLPKTVGFLAKISMLELKSDPNYMDFLFKRVSLIMRFVNMFCIFLLIIIPVVFFKKLIFTDTPLPILFILMNVVNFGVLMTAPFFMLDIMTHLVFTIGAVFYLKKNNLLLVITICLGLFVKEITILMMIPLLFNIYKDQFTNLLLKFFYLLIPIFTFFFIRLIFNDDLFFVQIGWNLSEGQISSKYINLYLFTDGMFGHFLLRVFSSIGLNIFICSYLRARLKLENEFFLVIVLMTISIVILNIILASAVLRVVSCVTPFLIFYSLQVFQSLEKNNNKINSTI